MPDPNKAWNQKDKSDFAKGASGDYKPDYWKNLKEGLGFGGGDPQSAQAANSPQQAGSGLMGPDRQMAEQALSRKLQRINGTP